MSTKSKDIKIKPYLKNAKKHPQSQIKALARAITAFGFSPAIEVDTEGVIISGHGRWLAAQELGLTSLKTAPRAPKGSKYIPYIILDDLNALEVRQKRLADNKLAETDTDMIIALEDLKEIQLEGGDITLTGYDTDLLIEPNDKDDLVPETPAEPQTKLGDLYILGNHRVLCGDSTKLENVERLMDGKKADLSFTSPPYNLGENGRLSFHDKSLKNKYHDGYQDNNPDYRKLITDTTNLSIIYAKDVFVNLQILAKNKKDILLWMAELVEVFKDIFFWKKQTVQPSMAENVANSQTEIILLFGSENTTRSWGNQRFRGTFSNFIETKSASGENKNALIHNATFPVELPSKFIIEGYKEGSLILDLFIGTGTTLIASQKTGRICYGMELDPKYVDVIVQRYVDYTSNAIIIKNGQEITWQK